MSKTRVLVLKPDHLGDFALSLPTLWEMVRHFGAREALHLLVHPLNQEWSKILPWLPDLESLRHPRYDWGQTKLSLLWSVGAQMRRLRSNRFDWGIDLLSARGDRWGPRLLHLAGCEKIYSPTSSLPRVGHTPVQHEVESLAQRVPAEWGVNGTTAPEEFIAPEWRWRGGKTILLAPAARTSAKAWPRDRWQRLLQVLPRESTQVLIPPDASKTSLMGWVPPDQQLRVSSIAETLRALQRSSSVVALDTAVAHFAWLVGTPLVQLFAGTADPLRWGSLATGTRLHMTVPCAPCKLESCSQPQHDCMNGITVDQVLAALSRWHG